MAEYGKSSERRLITCHGLLQELFRRVVKRRDCSITDGHRGEELQNGLYAIGRTKPGTIVTNARFGESRHNDNPSMAVDIIPWPEKWADEDAFDELSLIVWDEWRKMHVTKFKLVWGGDWDGDGDRSDQKFIDLPHWELRPI